MFKKLTFTPLKLLLVLALMTSLFSGCSKSPGKTSAKVKLQLAGIVDIASGIGSGGAILFGRNNFGEIFGKRITGPEENLDLPNGSWVFYAVMWGNDSTALDGKVHCGKSVNNLTGTSTSIAMDLNNANCVDPEFSSGRHYFDGSFNRFSKVFIEECDDISISQGFKCGLDNQGSALSYRFIFSSFKKSPNGGFLFGDDAITSACKAVSNSASPSNIHFSGLPINFPSGNGQAPFVGRIEFFMGSNNCTIPDPKGIHTVVLNQGLGTQNPVDHRVITSSSSCSFAGGDFTGTAQQIKNKCESLLGAMNAGSCMLGSLLPVMSQFAPAVECASQTASTVAIKHLVSIPKPALCDRYHNQSTIIGAHPFAGGDGSFIRPFKICNEWQINQIGEYNADLTFTNKIYKLMNDLDMNKTDFGAYAKPACVGVSPSLVKQHHNLNPLDQLFDGDCNTARTTTNGFQGIFIGNNKTISHARINAESVAGMGFVRKLWGGAVIKNLNFVNLEVDGGTTVGGIAGTVESGKAEILNITIKGAEIVGRTTGETFGANVGAITGSLGGSVGNESVILNAKVVDADLRGRSNVGGLVGNNFGFIENSMFRGHIDGDSANSSDFIGGIVGYNQPTGKILKTYSEGFASSHSTYLGGIAAKNGGLMQDVYSTMVLNLKRGYGGSSYVGGIAGYNFTGGGVITNCYSDTKFKDSSSNGTTVYYGGIVDGTQSTGVVTANSCYTQSSNAPSSYIGETYPNMRLSSIPGSATFSTPANWLFTNGILPKFAWENRDCFLASNLQSVADQVTVSGRGSVLNPIVICNITQFEGMNNRSSAEYYRLAEDINLGPWSDLNVITNFNGTLNGADFILYGLSLSSNEGIDNNLGIIRTNNGKITNLNLYGNSITNNDTTDTSSGLLVGSNFGVINDIYFSANYLEGFTNVGLVAGKNAKGAFQGIINNISIEDGNRMNGDVVGLMNVGGAVGYNDDNGVVSRVSSGATLKSKSGSYQNFGGIAGANNATLDQASFHGSISFNSSTGSSFLNTGGIVGVNTSSGTISNVYTENYSEIRVKNTNNVGGLVGYNFSGSLSKSFALGKVIYDNAGGIATPSAPFHSLVGSPTTSSATDSYFLQNNLGSWLGSNMIQSCSGSIATAQTVSTSVLNFSNAGANANMFSYQNGGGSGNLVSLNPMSITANDLFDVGTASCLSGNYVDLYRNYVPLYSTGQLPNAGFSAVGNFSNFDLAYTDYATPANSTNQDRLYEYYKSLFYNRAPTLAPPIWELESGESHPRLVQLER